MLPFDPAQVASNCDSSCRKQAWIELSLFSIVMSLLKLWPASRYAGPLSFDPSSGQFWPVLALPFFCLRLWKPSFKCLVHTLYKTSVIGTRSTGYSKLATVQRNRPKLLPSLRRHSSQLTGKTGP